MHNKDISWHPSSLGLLTYLFLTILLECPSPVIAQEDPVILLRHFQDLPIPRATVPLSNRHRNQLLLDLSEGGDVRIKYGKTSLTIACSLDKPDDRHRQRPTSTSPPQLQASTTPNLNLMLTFAF